MADITESNTSTDKTVPIADYEKLDARAKKHEAEAEDLRRRLESYKDIDPERVKADREALEQLERERAATSKDTKDIDALIAKKEKALRDQYGSTLDEKDKTIAGLTAKVQRYEIIEPVKTKAVAMGFNAEELEMVELLAARDFMFDAEGTVIVKGADGKPKPSAKNPRNDMDADEWLEELAAKHPGWLKPKTASGGRDSGQTTSANGASKYEGMSLRDIQSLPKAEIDKIPADVRRQIINRS